MALFFKNSKVEAKAEEGEDADLSWSDSPEKENLKDVKTSKRERKTSNSLQIWIKTSWAMLTAKEDGI